MGRLEYGLWLFHRAVAAKSRNGAAQPCHRWRPIRPRGNGARSRKSRTRARRAKREENAQVGRTDVRAKRAGPRRRRRGETDKGEHMSEERKIYIPLVGTHVEPAP